MTVGIFLQQAADYLLAAGIASARLDTLILLEDTLQIGRAHLLAHPELELSVQQQAALTAKRDQRGRHMPLAYIRGTAPFYGRTFTVTPQTLIPRPETEAMVMLACELPHLPAHARFADIGTGTGCIGISVALELLNSDVTLYDIDPAVLDIATKNAQALGACVATRQQDLLSGSQIDATVVLANLPYVPDAYPINAAATFEPKLALFAGTDGLDLYRTLWQQISTRSTLPLYVLTESLMEQHQPLAALARKAGYHQVTKKGLIQLFAR